MAQQTPSQQLYDLLVSRNFDPELLDSTGKPSKDPGETDIFSFDFIAESGKNYGTVVIMLAENNDMEIYFGDNVGRSMEGTDKQEWFDFLYQLRMFAKRNLMSFGLKNLNRLRYSMQGQAAIKEGLFESWVGTKTTSWNGQATEARLMIKHKRPLGEGDKRFRYVESLFVETAEGERYKLPFTKLAGGRAMVEHVRQGGRPYDACGQHITAIVEELNILSRFRRANHGKIFEGDTAQLVTETNAYYETLQHTLKGLSTKTGYGKYFETWNPETVSEQEVVIEGLKHLFVTQSLDTRIEEALPILARIQQQGNAMKEANIFEAWANRLVEGTWSTPDTPEAKQQLVDLLSAEFIVGPDATNATEQLYDLLGDDELFDQLQALADQDANADARQVIYDRMQELSNDPDVQKVINSLNIDADLEIDTPESALADLEPNVDDIDDGAQHAYDSDERTRSDQFESVDPMIALRCAAGLQEGKMSEIDIGRQDCKSMSDAKFEKAYRMTKTEWRAKYADVLKENVLDDTGSTLQHIKDTFKRDVKDFIETGEVSQSLHDALYDYYFDDMPYGVQKARDGDPYEWVADRFGADLGLDGYGGASPGVPDEDYGLERESVMHGDYAEERRDMRRLAGLHPEETDEGILGTAAGGLAGLALGGPLGAIAGAGLGQAATSGGSDIIEQGEEETDEGWKGQLAGGTVGSLAGTAAGAALGPVGAVIGGALGGTAGQMIGDELGGEEETDEGKLGAVGGGVLGMAATKSLKGGVAGAKLGSAIQDRFAKKDDSSALAGQYGHSGKMKEVGKDTSFLDRLKELSGMKK